MHRLEQMLDGAQSAASNAARSGITPREDELAVLEHYRSAINDRDELSYEFDTFIPPTEDKAESAQKSRAN